MSVQEIEIAVAALPQHDLTQFVQWFQHFQEEQARQWDEQIARDAQSGRLNTLLARAKEQMKTGECHELTPGAPLTPR